MAKQDDLAKLAAREGKRKQSIVGSIAGVNPPEKTLVEETSAVEPAAARGVVKPAIKETRSAKFQALFTPSLKKEAEKQAADLNISLNEVINQLLQDWVKTGN